MIDNVDEIIISTLSKNSRQSTCEMKEFLSEFGYSISDEEIDSRISTLEKTGVITGYTISIDTRKLKKRITRFVLVTFRPSQHLSRRIEGLKKYHSDAPFVIFSGRTRGGYDWISVQCFANEETADEEADIYRNLFGDIIQSYEVYDFVSIREPSLGALTCTDKEYKEFIDEWVAPFMGDRS